MNAEGRYRGAGYFPMFISLEKKPVLVVGAGEIGSRRAQILAEFGAQVTVVAPDGCLDNKKSEREGFAKENCVIDTGKESDAFADGGSVVWHRRTFVVDDLNGKFLVVAATSELLLNNQIADLCRERGVLVNHAGDQSQCDFYFPAIARKEDLVIGITSSGKDHGLVRKFAARLRQWLEEL
ncbi:MAG: bifunctional precorrin-2 dehydrogenase/sirohydrochlorin ferrochelatase [Clostridiales bacterium]|nr:bifunctional precorrin-2 dehydrogenase/sirohydrochlorin ferrochelatase [Clostridiales bacterium]